ncbi:hypothetical protein HMPREF0891_1093 [Lactobacillus crispatus 214-1]|nr:hypothetical protein HMPREF0891_1093 [Lactobacillus crispatus 214-1]
MAIRFAYAKYFQAKQKVDNLTGTVFISVQTHISGFMYIFIAEIAL